MKATAGKKKNGRAMVEAEEASFPPPGPRASPIFSALRDAARDRGEN